VGSGQGAHGPDAETGGFDFITYWSRAGIASALTPAGADYPPNMPGAAFGDTTCGAMLSGGIAAAIAQRALTGHAAVVDVSLLGWGMWAMQPGIVGAKLAGLDELPKGGRATMPNPLVNVYRTSDQRFVALTMLQGQRYWPGFCRAIGRPDLIEDARFSTDAARSANLGVCIAELDKVFATRTLKEWETALDTQAGQWDVVQKAGELALDEQALANTYVQDVEYADGRKLTMVSAPVQFNRQALPARPAPELGADGDAVLGELGYNEDQIIELKVAGIVN
jgi:crotonobetainyl-CoA:carnitine CoA-transferase CaiB-like acyl-CoA transferase